MKYFQKHLFTRSVFPTAISRHKTLISCPVPVDIIRKTFDARREKTKKKKTAHTHAGYTGRYAVCSHQVKKASLRVWECLMLGIRKIREDTPTLIHLNLDSVNCTHVHVCCSFASHYALASLHFSKRVHSDHAPSSPRAVIFVIFCSFLSKWKLLAVFRLVKHCVV